MLRGIVIAVGLVTACGFRPSVANQEAGAVGDEPMPIFEDAPAAPGDGPHGDGPSTTPHLDAMPSTCVSAACTLVGGTCSSGTCVIHVTGTDPVVCPSGKCQVECDSELACKNSIDCSQATSCEINCNQQNSCQSGIINCSGNGCTVYCRADNTCDNSVYDCGTGAKQCDVQCCTSSACVNNVEGIPTLTIVGAGTGNGTCP